VAVGKGKKRMRKMERKEREGDGSKWEVGEEGKAGKWRKGGLATPSQNPDPPLY